MRFHILGSLLVGMTLASTTASADVHITMADGKVTVSAKDATISQILNEWARVGHTRIVNGERLPSAPVSIELTNLPEAQALDTVLRSASGYLAAPRAVAMPNASAYDRIFVLATSSGTPVRATPAQPNQGAFVPPMFTPPTDDPNIEPDGRQQGPVPGGPRGIPVPARGGAGQFGQPPIPQQPITQQQPMPTQQQNPPPMPFPAPAGTPGSVSAPAGVSAPVGVSRPGMLVPTQQPPGQARPDNNP